MKHLWYLFRGFWLLLGLLVAMAVVLGLPVFGLLWAIEYVGGDALICGLYAVVVGGCLIGLCYQMGRDFEIVRWKD